MLLSIIMKALVHPESRSGRNSQDQVTYKTVVVDLSSWHAMLLTLLAAVITYGMTIANPAHSSRVMHACMLP